MIKNIIGGMILVIVVALSAKYSWDWYWTFLLVFPAWILLLNFNNL